MCSGNDPALFPHRFCDLVNSITEEAWKGPEEGDCDNETLEVDGALLMQCLALVAFPQTSLALGVPCPLKR